MKRVQPGEAGHLLLRENTVLRARDRLRAGGLLTAVAPDPLAHSCSEEVPDQQLTRLASRQNGIAIPEETPANGDLGIPLPWRRRGPSCGASDVPASLGRRAHLDQYLPLGLVRCHGRDAHSGLHVDHIHTAVCPCAEDVAAVWAKSSRAHGPRMARDLVQRGGCGQVPDSHHAFLGT